MPAPAPQRGDVVRIREERWTVAESSPHVDATVLTVVGRDRTNRGCRARFLLPFEPIERLPSVERARVVSHQRWVQLARRVLAAAVPSPDSLLAAATADISILPYQLEPTLALVTGKAIRILIADEVGLGKTVQAGLTVAETLARRPDAHVLVLCPAGLRSQWSEELTSRFHLTPVVLDSTSLHGLPLVDGANPWAAHPLILTSTDYIKRPEVVRALEPLVWDLLVVDEAHNIAGNSDRHAAAALLAQRARSMVMLTATPHSGDAAAFARLTATGSLDASSPLLVFRRTRAESSNGPRRSHWLKVRLTAAELRLDRALMAYTRQVWLRPASPGARLAMTIVTRRACSSAFSLARTLERRLALLTADDGSIDQLPLPLDVAESEDQEPDVQVGAPGLENRVDERKTLEGLLTLAREAAGSSSKVRALTRLLRRSNEPAIVFTEYRDTLLALERSLAGFTTCHLHGGLNATERAAVIRGFACGKWRVLLATDAASEGLNLQQRCRLVVHLEVSWTPTRIEQRVGRVDRIGQLRTVHQVHLVAAGTVEESRVTGLAQRFSRVASALDGLAAPRPDELQIAGCVIGDEELPVTKTTPLPQDVISLDLREHAAREAARIMTARQLQPKGNEGPALHIRPFGAAARRIRRPALIWAVWLECTDADGHVVCETLVGVSSAHRWTRSVSAADIRKRVDESWGHIRKRVDGSRHEIRGLDEALRTATTVAMERERAIARAIEERQARMAATLLQGALFDRRVEREAVAQRALVEQALTRSRARLDELHQRQTIVIASRPAFSLIAW